MINTRYGGSASDLVKCSSRDDLSNLGLCCSEVGRLLNLLH